MPRAINSHKGSASADATTPSRARERKRAGRRQAPRDPPREELEERASTDERPDVDSSTLYSDAPPHGAGSGFDHLHPDTEHEIVAVERAPVVRPPEAD